MRRDRIRTTVAIPAALLAAVDRLVELGQARSRSTLLEHAIRRELEARERQAIDAEFSAMASDTDYQEEALTIAAEFSVADVEALRSESVDE